MKIKNLVLSTVAAAGLFAVGTTAANADTVTVKSGDTVSKIANAHNTTVAAIEKANSLKNVNLIYVGQQLAVNGEAKTAAQPAQQAAPAQAQQTQTTQQAAPAQQQQQQAQPVQKQQAAQPAQAQQATSTVSGSDNDAKNWIAGKESGGSYSAANGQYVGKYQLSASYLHGDYSAANQEKVADQYVSSRYGSWSNAKAHWQANGWY